jgi:hypothetical protein
VRRHAVEKTSHQVRQNQRTRQPSAGPGNRQSQALAQNHPEDIPPLRAQREANRDLARLLIHQTGDGSINSQAGQQQSGRGKQRRHLHRKATHGKRELLLQSLGAEHGKLRIDRLDLCAHLRGDGAGIDLPPQKARSFARRWSMSRQTFGVPASASDSVRASAITPTIVVQAGLVALNCAPTRTTSSN